MGVCVSVSLKKANDYLARASIDLATIVMSCVAYGLCCGYVTVKEFAAPLQGVPLNALTTTFPRHWHLSLTLALIGDVLRIIYT